MSRKYGNGCIPKSLRPESRIAVQQEFFLGCGTTFVISFLRTHCGGSRDRYVHNRREDNSNSTHANKLSEQAIRLQNRQLLRLSQQAYNDGYRSRCIRVG